LFSPIAKIRRRDENEESVVREKHKHKNRIEGE
jgi:hypothetical protein